MQVTLNAAVRIIPPSALCDHWVAEHLLDRKRYRLSVEAAALLVAAAARTDRDGLADRVATYDGQRRTPQFWGHVVDSLRRIGLLVDPADNREDPRVVWLVQLREEWSRRGWHEAAEYHALTYDYPCLDYSDGQRAIATDQQIMRLFQSHEPDADRVKVEYVAQPGVDLPKPSADMPTGTLDVLWDDTPGAEILDARRLAMILSLTFGQTSVRFPRTDAAPLLRRSSPSGGARHPSEGYLVVHDVQGIERGWYHVTMSPFSLRRLDRPGPDDADLTSTFRESTSRFPFPLRALVVFTSTFERNMYRYREPRTFRTVHMDVGHLTATLRMSARAVGVTARVFYSDEAARVERALGLDGMREGYMLTVALADGAAAGSSTGPVAARTGR